MEKLVCTHKGCEQEYDEASNTDTSCLYHPGNPVFHEGLKGWSCCRKRVVNFDDFLAIPGCAYGKHTNVPREKATPTTKPSPSTNGVADAQGVETFGGARPSSSATAYKRSTKERPSGGGASPSQDAEEEPDAPDAAIAVGTECRHNGCGATFEGPGSRGAPCTYHAGQAVFHEGSKYWSCCKPRAALFEEFLRIPGCTTGVHKFCAPVATEHTSVQCRHDWYQSTVRVNVSVYAKGVQQDQATIDFGKDWVAVRLPFAAGGVYEHRFALWEDIDPAASVYHWRRTKLDLELVKANGVHWDQLEA